MFVLLYALFHLLISHLTQLFFPFFKTYQLAEDLGKAFSDLETFRSFVEVEANVSAADMKVCSRLPLSLVTR